METSFKAGEKVGIKGEKDTAEIVKILPYGTVEVKMTDGTKRHVENFELNKIK